MYTSRLGRSIKILKHKKTLTSHLLNTKGVAPVNLLVPSKIIICTSYSVYSLLDSNIVVTVWQELIFIFWEKRQPSSCIYMWNDVS